MMTMEAERNQEELRWPILLPFPLTVLQMPILLMRQQRQ
jgi:hypothetical protein